MNPACSLTFCKIISLGAYCESPGQSFDGQPCEYEHSTCGGYVKECHGRSVKFPSSRIYCVLTVGCYERTEGQASVSRISLPII